ncbi:MAG: type II toxin-antitoxin system PemK/MazF family toxin [Sediminibacterium sp.]|nr:type II toxin-antitoxin system PemK/MazF family toxin [Sediminibacterium sp.]
MVSKQYEIWLANLHPRMGTEPGKTRPVVIVQTNLLNDFHPSTIICPITSKVNTQIDLLRVHIKKGQLPLASDILVDQMRAIDNQRLIQKVGKLNTQQIQKLKRNIRVLLDLELE